MNRVVKPILRAFAEQLYLIKFMKSRDFGGKKLKMGLEGNTGAKSKLSFLVRVSQCR